MSSLQHKRQIEFWESSRKRRSPDHPVVKAFVEPKIRHLSEATAQNSSGNGMSLLDIGCGNGFFTYYLEKAYHTVALDFSKYMLINNPCNIKICGSAMEMPFPDNAFDITFCSNLLHHLEKPEAAVLEMKRVSRRYVVLSEPNRSNPLMFLFGLIKPVERGTLKFSLRYMKKIIRNVGLKPVSATSTGLILPNKTPQAFLPCLKYFDGDYVFGFYNIIISEIDQ